MHAEPCQTYAESSENGQSLPPVLQDSPRYLLRGYDENERIVYGSGTITETNQLCQTADLLLSQHDITFVHVRSATNNCWQARIDTCCDDSPKNAQKEQ